MYDLTNVKTGDYITILREQKFPTKIVKVEKVNKNWFIADNIKFKFNGWEKLSKDSWSCGKKCKPYEQSDSEYISLRNKMHDVKAKCINLSERFYNMDLEQVNKILEILNGIE